MAGSRKGEHRGGARKGPRSPKFDASTGTIKPKGPKKGTVQLPSQEEQRRMVEIITGERDLMPKDVLLATMRTLYQLAMEYQGLMRHALQLRPTKEMTSAMIDVAVAAHESKMVQYLMLASQVSRDVAPFIHPRLAALAVTTDRNTEGDLMDLLMQQISETPRFKVIEHKQGEPQQADEEAA